MRKQCVREGIGLLICLFILMGCGTNDQQVQPDIKNGVLDLRSWNAEVDGNIELSGEWQFYWKQLLTEIDFENGNLPTSSGLYQVPNTWNGFKVDGKELPGDGYATFVLDVLIAPRDTPLAFKIQDMDTAYNLFVDNELVAKNGTVGISYESMKPEFRPMTATFNVSRDRFRIILQISNFHHRRGGPWSPIHLGGAKQVKQVAEKELISNGFLIGAIFIMGLYHLFLFTLRKEEWSYLHLGIFCILIALRSLLVSERYLHTIFPGINWEILQKLEYLSFYLAVPIFAMFIHSLFPEDFNQRILKGIQGVSSLFVLFVLFSRARYFTASVNGYQLFTVISGIYIIYVLAKAYFNKREGIVILIGGYLFLFLMSINEILFVNELVQTGYTLPLGMFVFIFTQAFTLSQRYSSIFNEIEHQTQELTQTNLAYKNEIVSRQTLEGRLRQSLQDFEDSRFALIMGLAKLAEYRDEDTGTHLERMREYVKTLAKELGRTEKYKGYITDDYILDIYQSSILHDIGKVGIKDSILLKPGKLTAEEFDVMKTHSSIGGDAIRAVEMEIQVRSFLTLGREIAYYHHEKWNGKGYPKGLSEEEIPLSARITALADVYDALTSVRPYKKAFSHEKAMQIILEDSGTHFDPEIVQAFVSQEKMFNKIREYLKD